MPWFELTPAPDSGAVDQKEFLKRAQKAAGALGLSDRATINDPPRFDEGLILVATRAARWVYVSDRRVPGVRLFARACGADARECPEPPILSERLHWAHAIVPGDVVLSRSAQDDESGDHSEVRFDPPEGGLIALNVRRPGRWEDGRLTDWLADELNAQPDTSKLRKPGVGITRIMAAAPDSRDALDAVKSASAALDLGLTGVGGHPSYPRFGLLALSVLVQCVLSAFAVLSGLWWLSVPCVPPVVAAAVRWMRREPGEDVWQRPRHRWWSARRRRGRDADYKSRVGGDEPTVFRRKTLHAYAFQASSFPVPAGALTAAAMPPAGTQASSTPLTGHPAALDGASGPLVGRDRDGADVRLSANAAYGGVALLGEPGGGKSNSMHGMMAHAAGHRNPDDVLVAIESKGADSIGVLTRLMPGLRVVDVNDPATPMVDLLGGGDRRERADRFADLMQQALGLQQIGQQSRLQLRDATLLGLSMMDDAKLDAHCAAAGVKPPVSWVDAAGRLCGSAGMGQARALAHAACLLDDHEVSQAVERLHGGMSDKGAPKIPDGRLAERLYAPMNKLDLLASAPNLFAPGRRMVSWRAMLGHGGCYAVNIGATARAPHAALPEGVRRLMGALLFQGLRFEVERSCAGWQSRHCSLDLFVDELTDVTGSDGTTSGGNVAAMEWLREKGRAFGVRLVVGTQNPLQLDDRLQASFLGFMTVCSYVLRAPASARIVSDALGVDERTVSGLSPHVLAVRTVGERLESLPVMVVSVPWFDGDAYTR